MLQTSAFIEELTLTDDQLDDQELLALIIPIEAVRVLLLFHTMLLYFVSVFVK